MHFSIGRGTTLIVFGSTSCDERGIGAKTTRAAVSSSVKWEQQASPHCRWGHEKAGCKSRGSALGHQLCDLDKVLNFLIPQFLCQ